VTYHSSVVNTDRRIGSRYETINPGVKLRTQV
jgi:hypothetical protein